MSRLKPPNPDMCLLSGDDLASWADEVQPKVSVFVLTSGIGEAGKLLARAAAGQFPEAKVFVHLVPHISDGRKVEEALTVAAAHKPAILLHTLCVPEITAQVIQLAARHGIPCIDLLGPMFAAVTQATGAKPVELTAVVRTEEEHATLAAAMRYAIAHDDGALEAEWGKADLLLLGVSRAGKSPLSMFLATLGYKVANYPVCPGVPLPAALSGIDRRRVFGLTIDPAVLVQHRQCRLLTLEGGRSTDGLRAYTNLRQVFEEVQQVERMYKEMRITTVDCTDMPLPATASRIIRLLLQRISEDESPRSSPLETQNGPFCCYPPGAIGATPECHCFAERPITLCLVTSGAGFCGTRVLAAVRGQFPSLMIHIEVVPHINHTSVEAVKAAVKQLKNPIVGLTIVIADLRDRIVSELEALGVPTVDLLGTLQSTLQTELHMAPVQKPGSYLPKDAMYFRSVEAVEFALRHDCGLLRSDWPHADCVILGGPMTGKSALAVYLGTMGWAAANCTLRPDEGLPEELKDVDIHRIFALVCKPEVKPELQRHRALQVEAVTSGAVQRLEALFRAKGVPVIDVTAMPTESVANRIVQALDDCFGPNNARQTSPKW